MLEINPEIVCYLIEKARQFHVKEEVVIPEPPLNHADDSLLQILVDYPDDPIYREFSAAVQALEPDQQDCLVALMWIGRGDYTMEEWDTAVQEAQRQKPTPTARYLLSTPLVADYLAEGLALYGYSCED